MATMNIENGTTIDDLEGVSELNIDSVFLVMKDGLTKKVTLDDIRKAFKTDKSVATKDSTYYSALDIDNLLNEIRELINRDYSVETNVLDTKISALQSNITEELKAIKADIKVIKDFNGL